MSRSPNSSCRPARSSKGMTHRSGKQKDSTLVTGLLFGEQPGTIALEAKGIRFHVDLLTGHKTGLYLDQLDNYETVAELADGMRVLDCFSNQGAFAIACAKAGASAVTAVEISGHLVKLINENAQLNGVTITTEEANVFDYLSSQIRENVQFDLIILDPPSFTKSKESTEQRATRLQGDSSARPSIAVAGRISGDVLLLSSRFP